MSCVGANRMVPVHQGKVFKNWCEISPMTIPLCDWWTGESLRPYAVKRTAPPYWAVSIKGNCNRIVGTATAVWGYRKYGIKITKQISHSTATN